MRIDKPKGFFGLGFGVERLSLVYRNKYMCFNVKIFLGRWVVNIPYHSKAYQEYIKTIRYGGVNNDNPTK